MRSSSFRAILSLLVLSFLVFLLGGCSILLDLIHLAGIGSEAGTFRTDDYPVEIGFPDGWRRIEETTPFDLQATDGSSYASVFVFHRIDLAHDQEPFDLFRLQNEDLLSRRRMLDQLAQAEERFFDDIRIVSELWSAEKEGTKNYYYFNLVEFPESAGYFLWILFTALPSYAERHLEEWDGIVESVMVKSE